MTDDELMVRGAAGDEDAFRILVHRWETPVFSFLARMLGNPEDAQDLTQETFLRLCRQAGRYRPAGRFRSWLFRIAGNLARGMLRRRRILSWVRLEPVEHDLAAPEEGAQRRLEREETRQAVRAALLRLPARQRQAILLRRYEEMSQRDTAAAMGTTVAAVESLMRRGLAALAKDLGKEAGES